MKIKFDVTAQELLEIQQVLQSVLPAEAKVWVFGSRAKHQAKYNSDLDLAIECPQPLTKFQVMKLGTGFDESRLPYKVDIVDMQTVEPYFREIIEQQKVSFPVKSNVPELRFPEYLNEWKRKKVSDYSSLVTSGSRDWAQYYSKSGSKFIRMTNLNRGQIYLNLDDLKFVRISNDASDGKRTILRKDDILISITAELGKIGWVHEGIGEAYINQHLALVRVNESQAYSKFVAYLLSSPRMNLALNRLNDSGAKSGLNLSTVRSFSSFQPIVEEQQKIASFLTSVDDKLIKLRRKHQLLEDYKRGLMQKFFSQEVRFKQDDGSGFPDWTEFKADELFANHSNKKHNGDLPVLAVTQERGVVRRDEVDIDIKASSESVLSYKVIEPGDFVISLRSFQGGIEYSPIRGISSPAYTVLKPKMKICDDFFRYYFKKEDFISRLSSTVIGIRDGKQISYSSFSILKLPYPSVPEQQKIANALTSVDQKIQAVADQINQLETFKQGLLQKMFV